jgi:hypothetical protein
MNWETYKGFEPRQCVLCCERKYYRGGGVGDGFFLFLHGNGVFFFFDGNGVRLYREW